MRFDGQIAVVSGGASGLGLAVATMLRSAGASVAILDVSEEAGRRVAKETDLLFVRCDVADRESWKEAAASVASKLGAPTLLHLNAGVMTRPPDAPINDDPFSWIVNGGYRRVMRVNVDGVTFGLEAMLPAMSEVGGGSIVVTASTAGFTPLPFDPFYSMSKHAVIGLVRSIAPLLSARKVSVNALCPGGLATPLLPQSIADAAPRLMDPEEVAEVVLRLFSSSSTGDVWVKHTSTEPEYVATLASAPDTSHRTGT